MNSEIPNCLSEKEGRSAEETERVYFMSVFKALNSYRKDALNKIRHTEKYLDKLSNHYQNLLIGYRSELESIKDCIEINHSVIKTILENVNNIFVNFQYVNDEISNQEIPVLSNSIEKVQIIFKQMYRDWTSLGASEREQSFKPILNEIELHYPCEKFDRSLIKILTPGSGLGRLTYEIASRGFTCQGNEFNAFLLIVSYFVLNCCLTANQYEICPWILQNTNNVSIIDQTAKFKFPDVVPNVQKTDNNPIDFSMAAGDFCEVYTEPNSWDCVATSFFIDCAPNIVRYIETIWNILKYGGLWINIGPLAYHYADMQSFDSIEPSFYAICDIIEKIGFRFLKKEFNIKTKYCQNPKSMNQFEYSSVFFVCQKPIETLDK